VAGFLLTACGSASTENSADPLSLMDTSSAILLPVHLRHEDEIESQRLAFREAFLPQERQVLTVSRPADIYTGPGALYEVVARVNPGEDVIIDGSVGDWLRIADDGGYVSESTIRGEPWHTSVVGFGEESVVNACGGGLVNFTRVSDEIGSPYWVIHSYCGGEPVLTLDLGDAVVVDGTRYAVVSTTTGSLHGDTSVLSDLHGTAFLQSCDTVDGTSVIVGLEVQQ
jgi:hypothetical protein